LLRLENGINTFGRDDLLAGMIEDEWRILAVEYHDIDLLTELIPAVDDVSLLRDYYQVVELAVEVGADVTESVLSVDLMQCTGDGVKVLRNIYRR
jgi:hypothetical protein